MIKVAISTANAKNLKKFTEKAKTAGADGLEVLLTTQAIRQIRRKPGLVPDDILSLHQPFQPAESFKDKLLFLSSYPFPKKWHFYELPLMVPHLRAPIVCHLNDIPIISQDFEEKRLVWEYRHSPDSPVNFKNENCFKDFLINNQLNACFDVGYIVEAGWPLLPTFKFLAERIKVIHLYDVAKITPQLKMFDKNLCPGKGAIGGLLKELLQEVKNSKWEGIITLELLPQVWLFQAKEAVEFVKRYI